MEVVRRAFCYTVETSFTGSAASGTTERKGMRRIALLITASFLAAPAVDAIDINEGQLAIHGDGAWSFQSTSNKNGYLDASSDGNYDLATFNLLVAARPTPRFTITANLAFDSHQAGLEWMFVEWRVSDRLRLRAGRVKQPIGNSGELQFAGTTRPFYNLATSIYGPANMVADAYLGVGATGQLTPNSAWTLAYDLYAGALKLTELETYRGLEVPTDPTVNGPVAIDRQLLREVLGGRLSLTTPFDLTLRFSGVGGRLLKDEPSRTTYLVGGLSAEYQSKRLRLGAEAFYSSELGAEHSVGAHLTAAWSFDVHWQVAARVEGHQTWVRDITGISPLQRHREAAIGLNYWFTPGLVVKGSLHQITGNHFAYPDGATYRELATTFPAGRTTTALIGTQFAF
jgi:hypothetical protein